MVASEETDAAPRKPAHDESWGTRILLDTATALTLWFFNTSALRYLPVRRAAASSHPGTPEPAAILVAHIKPRLRTSQGLSSQPSRTQSP